MNQRETTALLDCCTKRKKIAYNNKILMFIFVVVFLWWLKLTLIKVSLLVVPGVRIGWLPSDPTDGRARATFTCRNRSKMTNIHTNFLQALWISSTFYQTGKIFSSINFSKFLSDQFEFLPDSGGRTYFATTVTSCWRSYKHMFHTTVILWIIYTFKCILMQYDHCWCAIKPFCRSV